ncbi:MAG: hypothetical protein CEE43_02525 [Promethearchaeota archaeon Loki_b32]|nr:MAG: hypothetical protein CEE43_02525 [Candidatus Lokiarchaeota archaeon Loki_b32]
MKHYRILTFIDEVLINSRVVEFRSDTVTKPSPEMWEMLRSLDDSKIGDDVEGEDPTVNELEEKADSLRRIKSYLQK